MLIGGFALGNKVGNNIQMWSVWVGSRREVQLFGPSSSCDFSIGFVGTIQSRIISSGCRLFSLLSYIRFLLVLCIFHQSITFFNHFLRAGGPTGLLPVMPTHNLTPEMCFAWKAIGITTTYIYEKSKKQKQKKLKLQIIYQIQNCSIYCTLGQGVCHKVPVGYSAPQNVFFFSFFRFMLLSKIELTSLFQRIPLVLDWSDELVLHP